MPATSFASLIRYEAFVAPGILLLKDGCLLAGFTYRGIDLDTTPDLERGSIALHANNAIKKLGQDFMLHFESVRVPSTKYPEGKFDEIVTFMIDCERKLQHETVGNHYETKTYCFITWQPPLSSKNSFAGKLFDIFVTGTKDKEISTDKLLNQFASVVTELKNSLSNIFDIEVLQEEKLLSAINLCVNGHPNLNMPEIPAELDSLLARDCAVGEPLIYDDKYIAVVSIDGFPADSIPCILDALSQLPFECRWSTRYIPLDYRDAYNHMSKEQKKWAQKRIPMLAQILGRPTNKVNEDAYMQELDINNALQSLNEGAVSFGHYTSVVVIRSDSEEELTANARETARVIEARLFVARIEKRNTLEAFLGSLPGHGYENVRKPMLHSMNLAHMIMLGTMWPGLEECPCPYYPPHSPALIQASTASGNPFRLHLHVGDVGHTVVLGPPGSGKSTLLATIAAQFDRYPNSQIFLFDKGRSMFPLIRAMKNASYFDLGSDDAPSLCPLSCLETTQDITWAIEYVETLVKLNGGVITPENRGLIENAIITMSKATSRSDERKLSDLTINIQDEHIKNALNIYTLDGAFGQYLDGDKTDIKYSRVNGYEMEELMGHPNQVVTPTLLYLFHEVEKRLDGRPTLIILDEAWLALSTPLFAAKLKEWLKVLRKANAAVILATQSLSDIIDSEIAATVLDCPTKILLPNPEAKSDSMMKLYAERLRLNDAEIAAIANAVQKQDYYYCSPNGKQLFRLQLGPVALCFTGMAGKEDLKRINDLSNDLGHNWPIQWLRDHRLGQWADYWIKVRDKRAEEASKC